MRIQKIRVYLNIVFILSFIRCGLDDLPFSKGKYIYWLIALLIGSLFFLIKKAKHKYVFNCFDVFVLILTVIGFLNLFYISNATFYNIKVWYYFGYLILYFVLRQELNTKEVIYKNLNNVLWFISVTAILNAVVAILQSINMLESPNEYFNSTGLFFSPNQLGIYLAIGFLSTIEILRKEKIKSVKIIFCIGIFILIYGLYLSECRGAYLGLSVAFLFLLYNYSDQKVKGFLKWKIALCSFIVLLGLFLIIWKTNSVKSESASGRLFIIEQSFEQIKERPLSGYGIDSFSLQYNLEKARYFETEKRSWNDVKNASYIYNANNDFLELTFELGIVWLSVFFLFIVNLSIYATQSKEVKICSAIGLCLLIFALTNNMLSVPLFVIIGCYCSVIIINLSDAKPIYAFKNSILFQIGIAVAIISTLVIMFLRLNAEQKLLSLYDRRKHFTSLEKVESYISKIDANGEELFMAGGILLKNKYQKEGMGYLSKGFERSGKPSLGKILAGLYEKQGEYDVAEQIYQYNVNVEPFRYDARIELFRLFVKTNQIGKAEDMAFEIINLPVKKASDKVDRFKEEAEYYINQKKKAE